MKTKAHERQGKVAVPKTVCGAIVALAMFVLPLPVLAEAAAPSGSTQSQSSAQTQSQPSGGTSSSSSAAAATDPQTPASTATAPTPPASTPTVTQTASTPAGTLQATPGSPSSSVSLQGAPSGTSTNATATNDTSPSGTATTNDKQTTTSTPTAAVKTGTTVTSDATSGNATLQDNRDVGDAKTGNANAGATVVNVANANGRTANDFQTFNCDIRENLQGNIVIDPTTLLPFCSNTPAGTNATNNAGSGQGVQSGSSLVDIMNKIVLNAASGNATIDNNRDTGNATTGDAAAIANIMNIANTAISAQRSFLGVVNIYGNLQGNILVPQSLVDGLAKSGAVPVSGNLNTNINNNINANATSGNALIDGNRDTGNATSGNAATGVTIMNLTGQQVVAKNSLLVFVNVMGKWMGMIVPAPGSKTAMLGSGLQGTSASAATPPIRVAGDTHTNITNDITVNARSGDASITNNRDTGDATTGRAQAGVNLLNITDSNFVLDDWFGALFINVLGSWLGNFDIQSAVAANGGTLPVSDVQVYRFDQPANVAPAPVRTQTAATPVQSANSSPSETTASSQQPVQELSSTTTGTVLGSSTHKQPVDAPEQGAFRIDLVSFVAVITALTLLAALVTAGLRRRLTA